MSARGTAAHRCPRSTARPPASARKERPGSRKTSTGTLRKKKTRDATRAARFPRCRVSSAGCVRALFRARRDRKGAFPDTRRGGRRQPAAARRTGGPLRKDVDQNFDIKKSVDAKQTAPRDPLHPRTDGEGPSARTAPRLRRVRPAGHLLTLLLLLLLVLHFCVLRYYRPRMDSTVLSI
jgi:hypothetical protein